MLYLLVITICLIIFIIGPLLFKRLGLVDIPDGQRKQHSGSIPLSGGFCILMALCLYGHFSETHDYIMFYGFLTIWFFYFLFLNERTFEN